jgi:hypothetical protein
MNDRSVCHVTISTSCVVPKLFLISRWVVVGIGNYSCWLRTACQGRHRAVQEMSLLRTAMAAVVILQRLRVLVQVRVQAASLTPSKRVLSLHDGSSGIERRVGVMFWSAGPIGAYTITTATITTTVKNGHIGPTAVAGGVGWGVEGLGRVVIVVVAIVTRSIIVCVLQNIRLLFKRQQAMTSSG